MTSVKLNNNIVKRRYLAGNIARPCKTGSRRSKGFICNRKMKILNYLLVIIWIWFESVFHGLTTGSLVLSGEGIMGSN
jgi:hypothetical protein